jgi:AcrR family transcriptional regulator
MDEVGGEQFSIRGVTRLCGYSAPTIYHHFGDKRGLMDALVEKRFEGLRRRLRRVKARTDPVDTLRDRLHSFIRFGLESPEYYQLLALRVGDDREPLESLEDSYSLIERPLIELQACGLIPEADPRAIIQSFWALVHGIITLNKLRPDVDWSREVIDVALDSILYGVVRPPPHRNREHPP